MVKTPDTRNKPWSRRVVHLPGASPATRFREDDMNQTTRRVFGVAGFALLLATSASFAQQPAPVRVRGTVEAVDGPLLTVKSPHYRWTCKHCESFSLVFMFVVIIPNCPTRLFVYCVERNWCLSAEFLDATFSHA